MCDSPTTERPRSTPPWRGTCAATGWARPTFASCASTSPQGSGRCAQSTCCVCSTTRQTPRASCSLGLRRRGTTPSSPSSVPATPSRYFWRMSPETLGPLGAGTEKTIRLNISVSNDSSEERDDSRGKQCHIQSPLLKMNRLKKKKKENKDGYYRLN